MTKKAVSPPPKIYLSCIQLLLISYPFIAPVVPSNLFASGVIPVFLSQKTLCVLFLPFNLPIIPLFFVCVCPSLGGKVSFKHVLTSGSLGVYLISPPVSLTCLIVPFLKESVVQQPGALRDFKI